MNVRLRKEFTVKAGIWIDDEYLINNYTIICKFITVSQNEDDHVVCLERIHFLFEELDNACFIQQDNQKKSKSLKNCKLKVIELPQEPVDQIIGMVLFYKINAVCEGKMSCTDLDISSEIGGHMHYLHSDFEETRAIPDVGWWRDCSPNMSYPTRPSNEKIVKFAKVDTWQQYDLNWSCDQPNSMASIHKLNEN